LADEALDGVLVGDGPTDELERVVFDHVASGRRKRPPPL
jgi:hypothetical protein